MAQSLSVRGIVASVKEIMSEVNMNAAPDPSCLQAELYTITSSLQSIHAIGRRLLQEPELQTIEGKWLIGRIFVCNGCPQFVSDPVGDSFFRKLLKERIFETATWEMRALIRCFRMFNVSFIPSGPESGLAD